MTNKHEAKTGAQAGQWVTCKASEGHCRNKSRHVSDTTLAAVRVLKNQGTSRYVPLKSITKEDIEAYDGKTDSEKAVLLNTVMEERKEHFARREERDNKARSDFKKRKQMVPAATVKQQPKKSTVTRPYSQEKRAAYDVSVNAALRLLALPRETPAEKIQTETTKFKALVDKHNVMPEGFTDMVVGAHSDFVNNNLFGNLNYMNTSSMLMGIKLDIKNYKPIGYFQSMATVDAKKAKSDANQVKANNVLSEQKSKKNVEAKKTEPSKEAKKGLLSSAKKFLGSFKIVETD